MSEAASGRIGAMSFRPNQYGQTAGQMSFSPRERTRKQLAQNARVKLITETWRRLPEDQRAWWSALAGPGQAAYEIYFRRQMNCLRVTGVMQLMPQPVEIFDPASPFTLDWGGGQQGVLIVYNAEIGYSGHYLVVSAAPSTLNRTYIHPRKLSECSVVEAVDYYSEQQLGLSAKVALFDIRAIHAASGACTWNYRAMIKYGDQVSF